MRLLDFCVARGWEAYVLTKRTYQGNAVFNGGWLFENGKFKKVYDPIKIDLVYDRSAGVKFPIAGDNSIVWVNNLDFKILAWDKWKGYKEIGEYMPKTFWLTDQKDIKKYIGRVKTDWVVVKPYNGLKGIGIFIGPRQKATSFEFGSKFKHYILQEFLDTSGGIPGITPGLHDLRSPLLMARQSGAMSECRLKGHTRQMPLKGET